MQKTALSWLWISLLIVILDQLSKLWITQTLSIHQSIAILPFLNFTLLHNEGAAFSFLANAGGWQRWLFVSLTAVITTILLIWLSKISRQQRLIALSLTLVIGGAIGNLIDRALYGYVVDFIDVYYQQWHWYTFNIADSAISIGVTLLLLDTIRYEIVHPQKSEN